MSDIDLEKVIQQASIAIGSVALISSAIMYSKIRSLESESDKTFAQAKSHIQQLQSEGVIMKDGKQVQFLDEDGEASSTESKVSLLQSSVQQLEKLMAQQITQLQQTQNKYQTTNMYSVPSMVRRQLPEVVRRHSVSSLEFKNSLLKSLAPPPQVEPSETELSATKGHRLSQLGAPRSRGGSYDELDPALLNMMDQGRNFYIHRQFSNTILNPPANQRRLSNPTGFNIFRILVTGGPCAGKSTAIASLKQELTQLGMKVLVVPEAAQTMLHGGAVINSKRFSVKQGIQFQKNLLKTQIGLEDTFIDIAKMAETSEDVVILIDRGLLDGSAYVKTSQWNAVLEDLSLHSEILRDTRYDAIIHMVTAADGAEQFYGQQITETLYESAEEAREKDGILRQAYMGHQNWILIKNTECRDFDDKIDKAKESVLNVLGKSAGTTFHKKFLLKKEKMQDVAAMPLELDNPLFRNMSQSFEEIQITEIFIDEKHFEGDEVLECSVQKKGSQSRFSYTHKLTILKNGQKLEKKRVISAAEYLSYQSQIKKDTKPLRSKRLCIIDNGVYIIVNYFIEKDGAPLLAVVQTRHGARQMDLKLPDYIKVFREVTDEPQYLASSMCQESYKMPEADKKATNL